MSALRLLLIREWEFRNSISQFLKLRPVKALGLWLISWRGMPVGEVGKDDQRSPEKQIWFTVNLSKRDAHADSCRWCGSTLIKQLNLKDIYNICKMCPFTQQCTRKWGVPQLLNKYVMTLRRKITWVTDCIQSLHSVQVVVATFERETHFKISTMGKWKIDINNVKWLSDWLIWDPCFSRSSSSDKRRGSKHISWTLDSLESIFSFSPWKDKFSTHTM